MALGFISSEQLQRRRQNGGYKTKRTRAETGAMRALALALLAKAPSHCGEIRKELGISCARAGQLVAQLLHAGQVIVIGTAEQAGKTGVRRDAQIYALPGTPPLPEGDQRPDCLSSASSPRVRRSKSGQIAGPCISRQLAGWGGWR